MAGQTQRAGPWESNLGLEPEWDGAFGQFWCNEISELTFAGSFVHERGVCHIKLIGTKTPTDEYIKFIKSFEQNKTALWNGSVRRSSENSLDHISFSAILASHSYPFSRRSSVRLLELKLSVQWLASGIHIASLEDAKWDDIYLKYDLLPFVVNRLEIDKQLGTPQEWLNRFETYQNQEGFSRNAYVNSSDGEVDVEFSTKFDGDLDQTIYHGISVCVLSVDSIKVKFPNPLPILSEVTSESEKYPTDLASWIRWLSYLFEIILHVPTSTIEIDPKSARDRFRLYLPFNISKTPNSNPELTYAINLINDKEAWDGLIKKWFSLWDINGYWADAIRYISQTLRYDKENSNIVEFLLSAERALQARWNAEIGRRKEDNPEKIIKYSIHKSGILSRVGDSIQNYPTFITENIALVASALRHEFTHPGTKDVRMKLRNHLRIRNYRGVYQIGWLLLHTSLVLLIEEEIKVYLVPHQACTHPLISENSDRLAWLFNGWDELYEACNEDRKLENDKKNRKLS